MKQYDKHFYYQFTEEGDFEIYDRLLRYVSAIAHRPENNVDDYFNDWAISKDYSSYKEYYEWIETPQDKYRISGVKDAAATRV